MKHLNKIFIILIVCYGMFSCSSDENIKITGVTAPFLTSDKSDVGSYKSIKVQTKNVVVFKWTKTSSIGVSSPTRYDLEILTKYPKNDILRDTILQFSNSGFGVDSLIVNGTTFRSGIRKMIGINAIDVSKTNEIRFRAKSYVGDLNVRNGEFSYSNEVILTLQP
jgi:hypothetical protein